MSGPRRAQLAGIDIVWLPWPASDPLSAILDCLGEPETPSSGTLHVSLRPADGPPAPLPDASHRPLFFHGRTRVFAIGDRLLLWDGASLLSLSDDGSELQGEVHPNSLDDGHTFSSATLLIAIAVTLRLRRRFHLHAGLVSLDGLGTLLVAGDAAHGKTTTTLSLLRRGGLLAGDDTLYIDPAERCIWGLPKPLNLSPRTAQTFAELTARHPNPVAAESGKSSYPAALLFPGALRPSLSYPDWLLFPRITGEPTTRLEPLAPTDALGNLMTASALVAVDELAGGEEHLAALLALVSHGRSYELLLGLDALERPEAILDLLTAEANRPR
jgi:hypothetical protein